ncbi:type II toxin-antitoxin system VapB family antitoxin [Plantactinospora sp. B6F1]|uniref:type II toxin-antitoxin system VapB family antitoxin n=1 Tax=Plantactinospora sp. B6F1 TaxID=3158971 RepID=UPI0032D8C118
MSRTILDIDDELLAEAAKIFGTTTKKATVNAALQAAVNREKRREFADWLKNGGLPGLTGPTGSARPDAA